MMRHLHSGRSTSITTAPESPSEELGRRQKRYAVMAVIFIATFTSAALLHRDTALALLLCGVAMTTLVLSVIGANVRSPRRRPVCRGHIVNETQATALGPGQAPAKIVEGHDAVLIVPGASRMISALLRGHATRALLRTATLRNIY